MAVFFSRNAHSLIAMMGLSLGALAMSAARCAEFPPPAELPSQNSLPDPLVAFDGSKINDAEQWKAQRRPELKALFEHYMAGYLDAKAPSP